jgi:hypothetical protein
MNIQKLHFSCDNTELIQTLRDISDMECLTFVNPKDGYCMYNKFRYGIVYYRDDIPFGYAIWKINLRIPMCTRPYKTAHIHGIFIREPTNEFFTILFRDIQSFCIANNVPNMSLRTIKDTLLFQYCIANGFDYKRTNKGTLFRPVIDVVRRRAFLTFQDPFPDGFMINTLFDSEECN